MPRKRKLPDGIRRRGGAYYSDFYAGGRRVRKRLSTDLDAAETILNDLKAWADKADFGLLDNDYPLADLRDQYLKHCRQVLKPNTVERYETCLANALGGLPARRASQLSGEVLRTYRDGRGQAGATPRTVNMEVTVLGGMLRWGVKERLIGSDPTAGLKPLRHDHAKEGRALTAEEVKKLLDASPPHWRDVWYAFLVTGLRKNELAGLTWRDVDWEGRELVVCSGVAKNHRERRIPIDNGLWDILRRLDAARKDRRPGGATPPASRPGSRPGSAATTSLSPGPARR
jgi:integrase